MEVLVKHPKHHKKVYKNMIPKWNNLHHYKNTQSKDSIATNKQVIPNR